MTRTAHRRRGGAGRGAGPGPQHIRAWLETTNPDSWRRPTESAGDDQPRDVETTNQETWRRPTKRRGDDQPGQLETTDPKRGDQTERERFRAVVRRRGTVRREGRCLTAGVQPALSHPVARPARDIPTETGSERLPPRLSAILRQRRRQPKLEQSPRPKLASVSIDRIGTESKQTRCDGDRGELRELPCCGRRRKQRQAEDEMFHVKHEPPQPAAHARRPNQRPQDGVCRSGTAIGALGGYRCSGAPTQTSLLGSPANRPGGRSSAVNVSGPHVDIAAPRSPID
ncbi:hypothetical protein SAMN04515671_1552 [Nakamurella panacisegetis]|uniref:Uncharacterized protein n=1 Tax=Nakamurella panacisegetis TaxID=1090615 RepID=A0A1H0L702_9ACTN|nr:hypothetical protein SAMN04515671_1552 [Nakamurella panacisegetis]